MNGSTIPCFPKKQVAEPADDSYSLDTTMEKSQQARKLFYDYAFFFFAYRECILNDSRMFLAPVPIYSGLADSGSGGFQNPTLGVYVEFWLNCPLSTKIDKNDSKMLVCSISGSPMTGSNLCDVVYEDGKAKGKYLPYFHQVWHSFVEINKRYEEAKASCESYSLQQVVDILINQEGTEYDTSAVDAFFYKREADYWKSRYRMAEATCDSLRKGLRWTMMETKREQLAELASEADCLQTKIEAMSEEIQEKRHSMLVKLRAKEITSSELQRWWLSLPIAKERLKMEENLKNYIHSTLKSLFPRDYMIMSMDDVREFLATPCVTQDM